MPRKKTSPDIALSVDAIQLRKSVGAIHTSASLTLVQRKLANVLLYNAYDNLTKKRTHTIPLPILCTMMGWEASNRIEHLKDAMRALASTTVEFNLKEDGKETWRTMAMLSFGEIQGGTCTYRYDEYLAEKFFDPAIYAMINLGVQKCFDSGQALNLYENTVRFRNTKDGSTGYWSLPFLRSVIGATATYYDEFRRLNDRAIKPAIKQINEESDIMIDAEAKKAGKTVVSMRFLVRGKTPEELEAQAKRRKQTMLPGMSFIESVDAYQDLRETEAFKLLRKHGISERLAFAWIQERGEQVVMDLVTYTEERDSKSLIKTNTKTYLTHLVKSGAEVGQSEYDKEKTKTKEAQTAEVQTETQQKRLVELEAEFRTMRIKVARNNLTLEERQMHAKAWLATPEWQGRAGSYDPTKGRFSDAATNIGFEQVYLVKVLSKPHSPEEFRTWLKTTKKLDPEKLGLKG